MALMAVGYVSVIAVLKLAAPVITPWMFTPIAVSKSAFGTTVLLTYRSGT
jgi:hypothetical protein